MKLDNNGALEIHGNDQGFIKFSSTIHPFSVTIGRVSGPHGADSIYGAPNLWLDAANQVFIKKGWATVAMDGAEYFPYSEPVDVGEVVVLDPTKPRSVKATEKAYDTTIIGAVSTNPAFILGGAASEAEIETIKHHYVPVALIGTVPCRVDADIAPIHAGDLLTTSPTRGYAQKVQDSAQASGAILGKALEGLEKGKGLISILVMMS